MKRCSHCGKELKPEQQYGFGKVYCQKCWLRYGSIVKAKQLSLIPMPVPMDELWNDEKRHAD